MTDNNSIVIKQIDKNVVNQICSGQVILTLATAVKELIENSVDAKATSIQIRLKDYGQESIEVSDNGFGVEKKNFQALTLKHHTSKISDFADVAGVETFGFRGEALSSLCSLSNVTIITKDKTSDSGNKLKFDNNGIIVENSKFARQTGTTVILEKIFYTLPVRHKEFMRNIKKEFIKMCNVLYAYGLLTTGISILCTNQVRGKKTTVMQTKGETLKSNVSQIFGPKQAQNLLQIELHLPEEPDEYVSEVDGTESKSKPEFDLEGFISSCAHGYGRTSPDRQFYYINSRPVDNAKISKLVNDIYHQYNPHQYPFVVLNIKILMKYIDVNVTPDKRLIFMRNERHLLNVIEASLHKIFQNIPAVVTLQNVGILSGKVDKIPLEDVKQESNMSAMEMLKQFRSSSYSPNKKNVALKEVKRNRPAQCSNLSTRDIFAKAQSVTTADVGQERITITDVKTEAPEPEVINFPEQKKGVTDEGSNVQVMEVIPELKAVEAPINKRKIEETSENGIRSNESQIPLVKRTRTDEGLSELTKKHRKYVTIPLTLNDIKDRVRKYTTKPKTACDNSNVKFFSQINPSQNESAENELRKELQKDSFKRMIILGQFNLGFIITKLGPDIFIVDQHATDEKYNFETLQLNTKIQSQKLVVPQSLNLTVEKEELFLHYAHIIRENGFDFVVDENEKATSRIKLTSVPLSKNWVFGKEDIDEILFILENAPEGKICRPSRIRDMFASRACRMSVMIGTALNQFEMKRLIDHMGEIEQPWNCPHGRPTIRHLVNLNMICSPVD